MCVVSWIFVVDGKSCLSESPEAGCLGQQQTRGVSFVSASRGIRAPASSLKSVARRCFEDTSIDAKSRYEAIVSREKREERAGCSIHCGHGLRSAGGLDSLADKTHACGPWSLSHASPQNTDEKEVLLAQLTDLSRRYARGPFNNTHSSSGLIGTTHVS